MSPGLGGFDTYNELTKIPYEYSNTKTWLEVLISLALVTILLFTASVTNCYIMALALQKLVLQAWVGRSIAGLINRYGTIPTPI